jgi:hypothetical protein
VKHEIYVENGVGRSIAEAINLFTPKHDVHAIFQHEIHPGMQRPQKGDEWWIKDVAGRGMVILTQDRAILDTGGERQSVIDSRARVIALGRAEYNTWQKLRCLVTHWEAVEQGVSD